MGIQNGVLAIAHIGFELAHAGGHEVSDFNIALGFQIRTPLVAGLFTNHFTSAFGVTLDGFMVNHVIGTLMGTGSCGTETGHYDDACLD